jgi:glycosyltransferase involved in cell wall biosynthesis
MRKQLKRLAYLVLLAILHAGYFLARVLAWFALLLPRPRPARDLLLFPYQPLGNPGYTARFAYLEPLLRQDGLRYAICCVGGQSAYDYGRNEPWPRLYSLYVSMFYRRLFQVLKARRYRAVYVQRGLFPLFPDQTTAHLDALLRRLNANTTIDFYDADYVSNPRLIESTVAQYAKVTVVNEYLETYFHRLHPRVFLLPLAIDASRYLVKKNYRLSLPLRLFWWGNPGNAQQLHDIAPALRAVAARFSAKLVLVCAEYVGVGGIEVEWHRWNNDSTALELLRSADIAIYPARDNEVNRGKQAFKVLEYMAAALPIVAAPYGLSPSARHRQELLIARDVAEWESHLTEIIQDDALRERLGRGARTASQRFHSPTEAYHRLLRIVFDTPSL